MKKISPKLIPFVIMVLSFLLVGSLAVKDAVGPGIDPGVPSGDDGSGG